MSRATSSRQAPELMPFRFARIPGIDDRVLLTSEAGEHRFVPDASFTALVHGRLGADDPVVADLEAKHMVHFGDPALAVRLLGAKLRTRKSFLRGGPGLHIFVVTLRCDHSCHYCQVSRRGCADSSYDMSEATAELAVERMFESPSPDLTVEFQGGEPLLAFETIRRIVELANTRNVREQRRISYAIATTLHHVDDQMLEFMRAHDFQISTSIDGPALLHDANRPVAGGSHARTIEGIEAARRELGPGSVSALTTLTRRSLKAGPETVIDEYVRLGFPSIFLRPLSPFGFAKRSARRLAYTTAEFLNFYERGLAYILDLNRRGIEIREVYAALLLRSILTPFPDSYVDLRSPVGAGFGALVYNFDGGVYASDEGRMLKEMGEEGLRLGDVSQGYGTLMRSIAMQMVSGAGLAEALPGCSDCAFVPFCGPDPAGAIATVGEPIGHRATSDHCTKHTGLFRLVFRLLETDPDAARILTSWALPVRPIRETVFGGAN